MTILDLLPATAPELAAELGITVRLANARLQYYAQQGKAGRAGPIEKSRAVIAAGGRICGNAYRNQLNTKGHNMKVTAILKDFSEQFYNGTESGSIPAFLGMAPADQWATVNRLHREKRVTLKIGTGQFRDAVELNQMLRKPCSIAFKLEPRRGYKLATFDIAPADDPDHCDYYPAAWTAPAV